ncbi:MAG: long-chain fatty acid--CoA ligase [Acidobacteriota bacterium]
MLTYENFVQLLLDRFEERASHPCLRYHRDGAWRDLTYGEVGERARKIAAGLVAAGVQPGDRVGIMSQNRPEWALADLATILAGGVAVTVYPDLPAEEAAYILGHSEAKVAFIEDARQLSKIREQRDRLPALARMVVFDEAPPDEDVACSLAAFESSAAREGATDRIAESARAPGSTPLTIIYTSGTTGPPKGAVLTHANILRVIESVLAGLGEEYILHLNLSFLPLAHALERIAGHFAPLHIGGTIAYARSQQTIAEDFLAVGPEYAIAVPRLFEKVYAKIRTQVDSGPRLKRVIFEWARKVGTRRSESLEAGRPVPAAVALRFWLADRLVFRKIRRRLGGRLRYFGSGGAPLAAELARFFHAAGILVLEGWGATETSAPATWNSPQAFRFGSVGKPLPHTDVRIAPDGELLVRGPGVFAGYFKDPQTTAEAFDADGYYRTGDIGSVDSDGYFYITDRKKELIINATGKNIPPQKIENMLRGCAFVSNAIVHCDRRPYLVALVTLDRIALAASHPELAEAPIESPALRELVERQVNSVNERLARFEQIKKFRILPKDFSPETGELTLTMKLKRRVIEARYKDILDSMYATDAHDAPTWPVAPRATGRRGDAEAR